MRRQKMSAMYNNINYKFVFICSLRIQSSSLAFASRDVLGTLLLEAARYSSETKSDKI